MSTNYPEEKEYLSSTLAKLKRYLMNLDKKVKLYAEEFKESKKYLYENRNNMDSMEIFSNENSINQIVNSGDFTYEQKRRIENLIESPYFARIDFLYNGDKESEKIYIGRNSFLDEYGDMVIYDWRAPISSMYYDFELGHASYEAPVGNIDGEIKLKRQFKISNSIMEYVLENSLSINDEVLQRELSKGTDPKMKNIVTTIQKEQNEIIRNENKDTLIIQGVAGSGKTSIALHRVAYFLYKYRDYLRAENIVIISPNKVFSDYISTVLPQLGEEPINELSLEDIAKEYLDKDIKFEKYYEAMNMIQDDKDKEELARIKFKSTKEFVNLLNDYIKYIDNEYFLPKEYVYNNIVIDKKFILEKYNIYKRHPIFKRLEKISDDIVEEINLNKSNIKSINKKEIYKHVQSMFKLNTTLEVYQNFYKYINKEGCLLLKGRKELEYYDVFPYIYIKYHTEGLKEITDIQHIVIDEMQDYTPIQYEVIKKIYKCKKTILGDFGQCVNQYNLNTLDILEDIFEDCKLVHINKSYRSTYEIINFAKKVYNSNIEPIKRHGKEPEIIKCKNINEEVYKIEKIINDFNENKSTTLGIICKRKEEVDYLYKILKEKYKIYKLDFNSNEFKEGVILSTIQMSKGLEFDEVLLPFVDSSNYNSDFDRKLLYVACTRAMNQLTLTYSNDISSIVEKN